MPETMNENLPAEGSMDDDDGNGSPAEHTPPKQREESTAPTRVSPRFPEQRPVSQSLPPPISQKERMACELSYLLASHLQPNDWTDWIRQQIYCFVESWIWGCGQHIGLHESNMKIHLFGSFFLSTYLPEGDIDITVQCPAGAVSSLMNTIYDRFVQIDIPVQFVQADVKLIKCHINDICVDISFNQLMGLSTAFFVTDVNESIPNNIFKRSLILLKAWAYYESRTLGAHGGLLGSYALTIMLVCVLNQMQLDSLLIPHTTELDVLIYFFSFYAKHDVRRHLITIYGVRKALSGEKSSVTNDSLASHIDDAGCLINRQFMQIFRARSRTFFQHLHVDETMLPADSLQHTVEDPRYEIQVHRPMNIADPLRSQNNLARGVHHCHATRIQLSIERAASTLQGFLNAANNPEAEDPTPRVAVVSLSGSPVLFELPGVYLTEGTPSLQCSILSFFENTFRKCVLPKLIERKPANRRDWPMRGSRRASINDHQHLSSLVAHGKTSPIRLSRREGYHADRYAQYAFPFGNHTGRSRQGWIDGRGRGQWPRKPRRYNTAWLGGHLSMGNEGITTMYSSMRSETYESDAVSYPSPRSQANSETARSHPSEESSVANRNKLPSVHRMTEDTTYDPYRDHQGFRAGDLIALTLPPLGPKGEFHKIHARRRSSSSESIPTQHVPIRERIVNEGQAVDRSPLGDFALSKQPHTQHPGADARKRNRARPFLSGSLRRTCGNEALHPVRLPHPRNFVYFPVINSPHGYPLCVPPEPCVSARVPSYREVLAYPREFGMANTHRVQSIGRGRFDMGYAHGAPRQHSAYYRRWNQHVPAPQEHAGYVYRGTAQAVPYATTLPPQPVIFRDVQMHASKPPPGHKSLQGSVNSHRQSVQTTKLYIPPHLRNG